METFKDTECKIHNDLPIIFICTDKKCTQSHNLIENEFKGLCEICLNLHDKQHKFIISISSLLNKTYEKLVAKNLKKSIKIKSDLENIHTNLKDKLKKDFINFSDKIILLLENSQEDLLNKIESQKLKLIKELEIWKEYKLIFNKISGNSEIKNEEKEEFNTINKFDKLNYNSLEEESEIDFTDLSNLEKKYSTNINEINKNNNINIPILKILDKDKNPEKNFNDNKIKIINEIIEKHMEQFVSNFTNENIEADYCKNSNTFEINCRFLFKEFSKNFSKKLRKLINSDTPMKKEIEKEVNFPEINLDKSQDSNYNNYNSNENDPNVPNSLRNNYLNNTNVENALNNVNVTYKKNSITYDNNNKDLGKSYNNNIEIINKNLNNYNNERDTFIVDPNGGDLSPKNSMILNFNNNGLFSIDTLRSVKNTINTQRSRIFDNDNYNNYYNKINESYSDYDLNFLNSLKKNNKLGINNKANFYDSETPISKGRIDFNNEIIDNNNNSQKKYNEENLNNNDLNNLNKQSQYNHISKNNKNMNVIEEERASYIMKTPTNNKFNSNKDSNEENTSINYPIDNNSNNNKTNNSLIKNFNHKFFELEEPRNIMTNKKGCWYSLDYIKSHNYIVCGYEDGEILIFKESDYSLVRTYRPRYKKIRRLIYSEENTSIIAAYDDGFFVIINILDFKFETYKKSDSQIYTFDIMKNYNILIWGGYDRKISYSQMSNLDETKIFWESNDGEVQCIYHDLDNDILTVAFRKNKINFFDFKEGNLLKNFKISENNDACGMSIKKCEFKDANNISNIFISGFFMSIHQFEISNNGENIDFIRLIQTPYTHIYDILFINLRYFLITTFEDGKILLMDSVGNKIIKVFEHFYNSGIQIKFIKDNFYLTSHGDNLKIIDFRN